MSLSYSSAVGRIREVADRIRNTRSSTDQNYENVPLGACAGRIAARDHVSPISVPAFDSSVMDGYAISSAATRLATPAKPARFRVQGIIAAGQHPNVTAQYNGAATTNGEGAVMPFAPCIEVTSGARFPAGDVFDACVGYEDAGRHRGRKGSIVTISKPVLEGANLRSAGNDFKQGDVILRAGDIIQPRHIMCLASVGMDNVCVMRKPRVAIWSTGDKLPYASSDKQEGNGDTHVSDVNGPYSTAAVQEIGYEPSYLGALPDDPEYLEQAIRDTVSADRSKFDILVSAGAVSSGKVDIIPSTLEKLGAEILFHGLSTPPGYPAIFAIFHTRNHTIAFFGLPGNPSAAAACFRFLVMPFLLELHGQPIERPLRAVLKRAEEIEPLLDGEEHKCYHPAAKAGYDRSAPEFSKTARTGN